MHDWPRLDVVQCTTGLEVRLLAALNHERKLRRHTQQRLDEMVQLAEELARRIKNQEAPPEPLKPVVKLVPPMPSPPFRGPPAREAGIQRIQKAVCKKFDVTMNEIKGQYRQRKIAEARHVAVMLCYALTAHSYPFIGRWFNYRDHSTMLNSVTVMRDVHDQLVKEFSATDPLFDWVDRAHELVMAGRAKPRCDVNVVVDIAAERVAFASEAVT